MYAHTNRVIIKKKEIDIEQQEKTTKHNISYNSRQLILRKKRQFITDNI